MEGRNYIIIFKSQKDNEQNMKRQRVHFSLATLQSFFQNEEGRS